MEEKQVVNDSPRKMATTDTMRVTAVPVSPALQPLTQTPFGKKAKPNIIIGEHNLPAEKVVFDPVKHLNFTSRPNVLTMRELGYPESRGVSPIGVSEPFSLFSEEAIKKMRAEIMSDAVWEEYQYSSEIAQCQLRGYAAE